MTDQTATPPAATPPAATPPRPTAASPWRAPLFLLSLGFFFATLFQTLELFDRFLAQRDAAVRLEADIATVQQTRAQVGNLLTQTQTLGLAGNPYAQRITQALQAQGIVASGAAPAAPPGR